VASLPARRTGLVSIGRRTLGAPSELSELLRVLARRLLVLRRRGVVAIRACSDAYGQRTGCVGLAR
jgi:hypothetical protein